MGLLYEIQTIEGKKYRKKYAFRFVLAGGYCVIARVFHKLGVSISASNFL